MTPVRASSAGRIDGPFHLFRNVDEQAFRSTTVRMRTANHLAPRSADVKFRAGQKAGLRAEACPTNKAGPPLRCAPPSKSPANR